MIKRVLSAFLAFTLIFSFTFTVNASTPESVITFTVEADTDDIAVGDTVTITVKASATKGIYGVSADLEIPSGFTNVANSGKLVDGAATAIGGDSGCTFVEGIKQIWLENASNAMTFNGTVSVATFDCVATTAGTYAISLTEIAGMDEEGGDFFEYAMLRLRLNEGLRFADCGERYPEINLAPLKQQAQQLIQHGLAVMDEEHIALTVQGFLLSNAAIWRLLEVYD